MPNIVSVTLFISLLFFLAAFLGWIWMPGNQILALLLTLRCHGLADEGGAASSQQYCIFSLNEKSLIKLKECLILSLKINTVASIRLACVLLTITSHKIQYFLTKTLQEQSYGSSPILDACSQRVLYWISNKVDGIQKFFFN